MSTIAPDEVLTARVKWAPASRSATTSRKLVGTAAVFDQTADRLGFAERIQRGAFADAIRDGDAFMVYAHQDTAILARQGAGTLRLREDAKGLQIEADIVRTQLGDDVLELVKTGHLSEMSFQMSDVEDVYEGGERVITRVGRLWECSVVPLGAYSQTSVEARASKAVVDRIERITGARPRVTVRDRSPYGPGSEFSFYRDLAVAEGAKQRQKDQELVIVNRPAPALEGQPSLMEDNKHGGTREALARLASVEQRDIGTTAMDAFVPVTAGGNFVANLFEASQRAQAVIANSLTQGELGKGGITVKAPRIVGAATVATHTELAAVSEQDPTTTDITASVTTTAGQVDISQQLFDQSPGGVIDQAISLELGNAIGAGLDVAVTTALLAAAGAGSTITYTDASASAAELFSKLMELRETVHVALGVAPDLTIFHPRRLGMIDTSAVQPLPFRTNVLASPSIPTNLGAGTNEDRVIMLATSHVEFLTRPATLRILFEVLSGTLSVRIQAYEYSALLIRQPKAVGVMVGSGLTPYTY